MVLIHNVVVAKLMLAPMPTLSSQQLRKCERHTLVQHTRLSLHKARIGAAMESALAVNHALTAREGVEAAAPLGLIAQEGHLESVTCDVTMQWTPMRLHGVALPVEAGEEKQCGSWCILGI